MRARSDERDVRPRSDTGATAWLARHMPTRETFERIRWLRPIAHRVLLPQLWRFHRRSVSRGVALGVFVGVIIPVAHTFVAALLALPAKANVPVAALTTFIANPLTIPPIWYSAYWLGTWLLHGGAPVGRGLVPAPIDSWRGWFHWLLSNAAPATATGLVVIAVLGSAVGYLLASFGWRWWTARKWRTRHGRSHHGA